MKVLIAYGSTEGQTRKIADAIASQIRASGHNTELHDTSGLLGDLQPESFDRIIVAGSVHDQRHQDSVEIFVLTNREHLAAKPTLFISVSIAAAFEDKVAEAQGYVDMFTANVDWQPDETLLVAGALRHGEYGYYTEQIVEHYVLKDKNLNNPEADQEFTDWEALAKAVDEFVGTAAKTGSA